MKTSITTLALNLLISERINQRYIFGDKIIEMIQDSNDDLENRKKFLNVIHLCIEDPSSEARNTFFQLAEYYTEKFNAA